MQASDPFESILTECFLYASEGTDLCSLMAFKRAIAVSLWILAIQSFTDLIASECQGGRMVGPVPTVTNERYMLIDIITIPRVLESSRLF